MLRHTVSEGVRLQNHNREADFISSHWSRRWLYDTRPGLGNVWPATGLHCQHVSIYGIDHPMWTRDIIGRSGSCTLFGAIAGSAMIANSPGTLSDITTDEYRALAFSIWSIGPLNGPTFGPIIGGFSTQ